MEFYFHSSQLFFMLQCHFPSLFNTHIPAPVWFPRNIQYKIKQFLKSSNKFITPSYTLHHSMIGNCVFIFLAHLFNLQLYNLSFRTHLSLSALSLFKVFISTHDTSLVLMNSILDFTESTQWIIQTAYFYKEDSGPCYFTKVIILTGVLHEFLLFPLANKTLHNNIFKDHIHISNKHVLSLFL